MKKTSERSPAALCCRQSLARSATRPSHTRKEHSGLMLRRSCAVLSLAASVVASAQVASASGQGCRYCEEGPAVPSTLRDSYLAPHGTGSIRLALTVTLPGNNDATSESGRGPPYPVLFFFSGFQVQMQSHCLYWTAARHIWKLSQRLFCH